MHKLTFNTILRYALIAGIFLIPFIPFYVAKDMFFPFITGKNFAFRILVELLLGGWLVLAWRDARYRSRFSWILAALSVFVGITAIADIFGEDIFRSFWSNFERMEGLVGILHFYAYFFVATSVLHTEKLWRRFFQTSLVASVFMATYSFFQLAGVIIINQGGTRIDATLGNASYLAVYALFHIFIAIALLSREKKNAYLRWVYGAIALLNFIILFNTATRGVVLGFIGGAILSALLIAFFEKQWNLLRKVSLGIIIFILLSVGTLFALRDETFVTDSDVLGRIASLTRIESVLKEMQSSRFQIWNMAWQGFKEHPILGWGQENFNLVFNKYYDPRMYAQEPWFDRAHNIVLDKLIEGGIFGLLSYLSIFGAALYYLWRGKRNGEPFFTVTEKALFTGLFAAYVFQNLFIFDQFISYFLFFSMLAFLHVRATGSAEGETEKHSEERELSQRDFIVVASVIVGTLLSLYVFSINGVAANRALLQALKPQAEGTAKNLLYFKKALSYDYTVGIMETREQFTQVAPQIAKDLGTQKAQNELFLLARDEMRAQIEHAPDDARYRMFIANLFMNYGLYDDAIKEIEEGIRISPKKQHIYYFLSNAYTQKGDVEKAFNALRIAFEVEPANGTALKQYTAYAIRIGRDDIAEKLLIPLYGTTLVPEQGFANAYQIRGRFDKVASILEKILEENPNDAQSHLSLAAAYVEMGKRQAAIPLIEKTIKLSPDFKAQGEELLDRIRRGESFR